MNEILKIIVSNNAWCFVNIQQIAEATIQWWRFFFLFFFSSFFLLCQPLLAFLGSELKNFWQEVHLVHSQPEPSTPAADPRLTMGCSLSTAILAVQGI